MIDTLIKVIDRSIKLLKRRELQNRNLFTDHIEPMFLDMAKIHTDYLNAFENLLSEYSSIPHPPKFYTEDLKIRKTDLEAIRVKVHSISSLQVTDNLKKMPDEAQRFFKLCFTYFHTASGEVAQYSGHYTDLIKLMEQTTIENEFPNSPSYDEVFDETRGDKLTDDGKLPPGRTMYFRFEGGIPIDEETFGYNLKAMLEHLKSQWAEITESYAACRSNFL